MQNFSEQFKLMHELVDSVTQASGASSQLIHLLQDHRFIIIRDALDLMKEGLLKVAPQNALVQGMVRG